MKKSIFEASRWATKKTKLAVLIPCRDMLHSHHAFSLAEMVKLNTQKGIDTHVVMEASTVLLTQRTRLALEAQNIGAEYMLWLDSDIVFPSTTALRLMSHNEDIVACNYIRRSKPYQGVAYPKIWDWQNPLPFEPSNTLVPVEGVGMGCMLMKTKILDKMPLPWFEFHYTQESHDYLGEDMIFCQKMAQAGYQVKIDTLLSMELHHLGTFAFNVDLLK